MLSRAAQKDPLTREFEAAIAPDRIDLAAAALIVAKIEYPQLDTRAHLERLDDLGAQARARLSGLSSGSTRARIAALNALVFEDEGFSGNHGHYDDFRNSCLNVVLDRRLGIPITLALVYMEVARRAGMDVQGVAFPGHFLMRVPPASRPHGAAVLLDPFDAGVEVSLPGCRRLLARHLGQTADEAPFDPALVRPCTPRRMIARMLNNLKRTYLEARSYSHARRITDLLLVLDPTLIAELRDRGLLSYHLDDFSAALRDLEDYLRLRTWKDDEDKDERKQLLEHTNTLRRRVASMN